METGPKQSYLVTGAAGFVGYHLALHLAQDTQADVVLVDNFARGVRDNAFEELCFLPNVRLFQGDLRDSSFVASLPEVDYVYHLASINGTENFYNRPFDVIEAAITPTLNLVRRFKGTQIKRMLLSSTSETYASTTDFLKWTVPTAEDVPLSIADISNPRWSYASGKIAAESALLGAYHQSNFPVTIIRYHNVYGPRMGNQHVIPQFLARALRGVFSLYGADNKRCFIYVQDAVRATRFLAEHSESLGQVFHVGTSEEISMQELASEIMWILGVSSEVEALPAPDGSVSRRVPDISKMVSLMGSPKTVGREIGLRRTIDYYREEFNRGLDATHN